MQLGEAERRPNRSTSSNDFDINVYDDFIKKRGNYVFSETSVMELYQIPGTTGPSFQWKSILEGLFCLSPLLLLVASMGQAMSVEFLLA